MHGAAQRYYLASLRLAGEAGDSTAYMVTLRALSVQARMLGHHREAVHLAEAAVRSATRATARTRAFLFGQLAVANAAAGDRTAAVNNLSTAERQLERASSPGTPVGAYHPASLSHQHAVVRACLGDRRGAIAALSSSVRHRPVGERRSRAITLARLAELQFEDGQLEQACGTWRTFLDDYPYLWSRRADNALATLRARLRPHGNHPVARLLTRRAAELNTARAVAT
jgi:tetratricopeptide (TPR) repeat protein